MIDELVGHAQPDLVLLNDGDLTYAKIRLDERSLKTAIDNIDKVDDSLARALLWGATWDMTRDAETRATDFVALVLRGIGTETDLTAVSRLPVYARTAVHYYAAPEHRESLKATWEQGLRGLLQGAEPGSDHQLAFLRAYTSAAHSPEALDFLEGLLDGSVTVPGLEVDTDLRWTPAHRTLPQRPGRRGPHPGGAGARQHHLRPGARGHGADRPPDARGQGPGLARRDRARRRTQRDAAPDRRGVPGGQPGRAAGPIPREVPLGGRHHLGGEGRAARVHGPGADVPDAADLPADARARSTAGSRARRPTRRPSATSRKVAPTWHGPSPRGRGTPADAVLGGRVPRRSPRWSSASPQSSVVECLAAVLGGRVPRRSPRWSSASRQSSVVECLAAVLGGRVPREGRARCIETRGVSRPEVYRDPRCIDTRAVSTPTPRRAGSAGVRRARRASRCRA